MKRNCIYCDLRVTRYQLDDCKATMTMPGTYAHTKCIDNRGKENMMNEKTQHILGAADSAHQGIGLAVSLLQESLGNIGEILTQGCDALGRASLESSMGLGQRIKNLYFLLEDAQKDAWALCHLLGDDLGVPDDEVTVIRPGPSHPCSEEKWRRDMFGESLNDGSPEADRNRDYWAQELIHAAEEVLPGEDEYDDDEHPF